MMEPAPKLPEGPVTRQFVYQLVEAAVCALTNTSVEQALDNFRLEVADRIAAGRFKENLDDSAATKQSASH